MWHMEKCEEFTILSFTSSFSEPEHNYATFSQCVDLETG